MKLVKIKNGTYNVGLMVKFIEHVGQREVGATDNSAHTGPEPVFGEFRFIELVFLDGTHVPLDSPQTEAFLRFLAAGETFLDLDRVDEEALGTVLVHNTEGGDIILPAEADSGVATEPDLPTMGDA